MLRRVMGVILCLVFTVSFVGFSSSKTQAPQKATVAEGTLKWRFKAGGQITSSPAIGSDGTIYVGGTLVVGVDDDGTRSEGYLYAIKPNGTLKWRYKTDLGIASSPAIGSDGTIYVGSGDYHLYAINPDGTLKWRYKTGSHVIPSPAIGSDGTIYVGSCDDYLYAINPDGTLKWRYKTGRSIYSSPAIGSDGTIYVGSCDDYLYAINPNGTLKWRYKAGGPTWSSPAIGSDGTIYVGGRLVVGEEDEDNRSESYLYAINPDGTLKWRYKIGDWIWSSSPAIGSDGTIYVCSYSYLYAVNPDGTLKWRYKTTGSSEHSSPAIGSDGTIYVGAHHYLYAVNPDGTLKWRYKTDDYTYSPPTIGPDGTIYVGSVKGYLYAIQGSGKLADTPWPMFGHDLQHTGRAGK